MQQTRAWEDLHDPERYGRLDANGYLELCKAAGFEEAEAQKAATAWANKLMVADRPVLS